MGVQLERTKQKIKVQLKDAPPIFDLSLFAERAERYSQKGYFDLPLLEERET
jgi:hypothetical protein